MSEPRVRFEMLDAGRGVAALLIVFHHAFTSLRAGELLAPWAGQDWSGRLGTAVSALVWVPDRLNHEAVLFFFVLSGFCIHWKPASNLVHGRNHGVNPWAFYLNRWLRIFPPLLVALVITALLDTLAPADQASSPASHWSGWVFLGNMGLLMPFFVPPYGSNGPLWALGYEAWYYALYPLWLWLTARFGGILAFGVSLAVGGLAVLFVHGTNFPLYPVLSTWWLWCWGALLAEIHAGRYRVRKLDSFPLALLVMAACIVFTLVNLFPPSHGIVTYALWGPLLGLMVYRCARRQATAPSRFTGLLGRIGRSSYSLYVVHRPPLLFISALWWYWLGPLPRAPWLVFPAMAFALLLGWLVFAMVERPLERLRARGLQHGIRSSSGT